jgi:hypothetical protein
MTQNCPGSGAMSRHSEASAQFQPVGIENGKRQDLPFEHVTEERIKLFQWLMCAFIFVCKGLSIKQQDPRQQKREDKDGFAEPWTLENITAQNCICWEITLTPRGKSKYPLGLSER